VASAIRLANAYPEIVMAASVGNETQVLWSGHRSSLEVLLGYVRAVRRGTRVPVTVADDYNFWNKEESRALAREIDFVTTHIHPLWNGKQLEEAVPWTRETFQSIRDMHPDHPVVLGETGWATAMHHEGEQARLILGTPGESQQATFKAALDAWIVPDSVVTFHFEAFDENWKGGPHPDEVEKHWGLHRADRTPKQAMMGDGQ
jgi:exo-beta-1,3-glucanase (GH17 family)